MSVVCVCVCVCCVPVQEMAEERTVLVERDATGLGVSIQVRTRWVFMATSYDS